MVVASPAVMYNHSVPIEGGFQGTGENPIIGVQKPGNVFVRVNNQLLPSRPVGRSPPA